MKKVTWASVIRTRRTAQKGETHNRNAPLVVSYAINQQSLLPNKSWVASRLRNHTRSASQPGSRAVRRETGVHKRQP